MCTYLGLYRLITKVVVMILVLLSEFQIEKEKALRSQWINRILFRPRLKARFW